MGVPSYDKSAFDGKGDRVPEDEWRVVNSSNTEDKIEVIIFEGWSTGFRALAEEEVKAMWEKATQEREKDGSSGRLGIQRLEDILWINKKLKIYDELTE